MATSTGRVADTAIERFRRDLERRAWMVRVRPNRAALLRLMSALCIEQLEERLSGRRHLDPVYRANPERA